MGIKILFHTFGLSCVAGSIFLQTLVLYDIMQQGFFRGVEKNSLILWVEIGMAIFGIIYFCYTWCSIILRSRHGKAINHYKNEPWKKLKP